MACFFKCGSKCKVITLLTVGSRRFYAIKFKLKNNFSNKIGIKNKILFLFKRKIFSIRWKVNDLNGKKFLKTFKKIKISSCCDWPGFFGIYIGWHLLQTLAYVMNRMQNTRQCKHRSVKGTQFHSPRPIPTLALYLHFKP